MDQLVGFLLYPPLFEIGKKIGKMLKYTPHFRSAFGTAAYPDPSACLNYTLTHNPTHALILTPNFTPLNFFYIAWNSEGKKS